jgi:predicted transcriptional regulator
MRRRRPAVDLATFFGPLELRVLDALWARPRSASVRELLPGFRNVAYTTIMTTLDRLFRKGLLTRERCGRAFAYRPARSRDELVASLASSALASLMPRDPASIRPLISAFVDEVGRRDASLLDELELEIQRRREESA